MFGCGACCAAQMGQDSIVPYNLSYLGFNEMTQGVNRGAVHLSLSCCPYKARVVVIAKTC